MRLGLLGCVAAVTLCGAAAAQAETIYVEGPGYVATEPGYVATGPDYVYTAPAPYETRRYIVADPAPTVLAEPPSSYVVVERPAAMVRPPMVVERERRVLPRPSGIVTTGSSSGSCVIDINGFERCY
jgi:hypothetical protein